MYRPFFAGGGLYWGGAGLCMGLERICLTL